MVMRMRFETLNASSYLVWRLQAGGRTGSLRDDGDVILLRLKSGEQIMILLVERSLSLADLQHHFQENTRAGIHTLFAFWVDMLLPHHGQSYEINDWMAALLSVQGGKIYGYEVAGREAYYYPVYFEGGAAVRHVRYGGIVDYQALSAQTVASDWPTLRGVWRVAGFGGPQAHQSESHPFRADGMTITSYYAILGLEPGASLELVKETYRMLARRYHPDLNRDTDASYQMKRINDAYQRILAEHHSER